MLANGRFGGHIVAGHVDGTGRINREQTNNAIIFTIEAPKSVMDYVIYKGSITIDELAAAHNYDEQTVVFPSHHFLTL